MHIKQNIRKSFGKLDKKELKNFSISLVSVSLFLVLVTIIGSSNSITWAQSDDTCSIYAIDDQAQRSSQFIEINPLTREVSALGGLHEGHNFESLEISSDNTLYSVSTGRDGVTGPRIDHRLYEINKDDGSKSDTYVDIDDAAKDIEALAYHPDGSLWGWSESIGLMKINTIDGSIETKGGGKKIEGLAWSEDGNKLYGAAKSSLYEINPNNGDDTFIFNLPTDTEALEFVSSNELLAGVDDGGNGLSIFGIDPSTGDLLGEWNINTEYSDIEGIATNCKSIFVSPTPTIEPSISVTPTTSPSTILTPTPVLNQPWIATNQGDVFYNEMDQISLSSINPENGNLIQNTFFSENNLTEFNDNEAFLSQYLLLKRESSANQFNSSMNEYTLNEYNDSNAGINGNSWFEYLGVRFISLTPADQLVNNPDTNNSIDKVSDIPQIPATLTEEDIILFITNSINFEINTCDRKSIFLVQGDLIINPDLVNETFVDGCLFLVQGSTLIASGENKESGDPQETTFYDQVHAFIITDSFITQEDPNQDGLYIKGSVITNTIELNRDLSSIRNEFAPSEYFAYDPRYMHIYDDLLKYNFQFNISESQYINTFQNN